MINDPAVHECSTIINPMIVEGQLIGGIAQGLGGALFACLASNGCCRAQYSLPDLLTRTDCRSVTVILADACA